MALFTHLTKNYINTLVFINYMGLKKIEVIAAILLLLSIFIIGFRLLNKEPIGFIIQDGNVIPIENTNYFTINDILIIIIFSWIGGMAALYLLLSKTESPA